MAGDRPGRRSVCGALNRAEEANRAKDNFLATGFDDLRQIRGLHIPRSTRCGWRRKRNQSRCPNVWNRWSGTWSPMRSNSRPMAAGSRFDGFVPSSSPRACNQKPKFFLWAVYLGAAAQGTCLKMNAPCFLSSLSDQGGVRVTLHAIAGGCIAEGVTAAAFQECVTAARTRA
jgi:hypothetical protein